MRCDQHPLPSLHVRHNLVVPVGERLVDGELERLGHGELVAGRTVLIPGVINDGVVVGVVLLHGVGDVELVPLFLEGRAARCRLVLANLALISVVQSAELVELVPLRLADHDDLVLAGHLEAVAWVLLNYVFHTILGCNSCLPHLKFDNVSFQFQLPQRHSLSS